MAKISPSAPLSSSSAPAPMGPTAPVPALPGAASDSLALRPVERETLWDQVYLQLRNALLGGHFEPGGRLVLRELADTLGTSITPVRDAVARLVANGVLELGARNTACVPQLGADTLRQLIVVRIELEGRAAAEAARSATAEDVDALDPRLAEMRGLIRTRHLEQYLDLHREFHFGIYALAGMPVLTEMIESLWLRCGPVLSFVIPKYVDLLKGTDHHRRLLDALRANDAAGAEAEIVADIREAGDYLLSLADASGRIRRP